MRAWDRRPGMTRIAYYSPDYERFDSDSYLSNKLYSAISKCSTEPGLVLSYRSKNGSRAPLRCETGSQAVCQTERAESVNLVGFSTRSTLAGIYAGLQPDTDRATALQGATLHIDSGVGIPEFRKLIETVDHEQLDSDLGTVTRLSSTRDSRSGTLSRAPGVRHGFSREWGRRRAPRAVRAVVPPTTVASIWPVECTDGTSMIVRAKRSLQGWTRREWSSGVARRRDCAGRPRSRCG